MSFTKARGRVPPSPAPPKPPPPPQPAPEAEAMRSMLEAVSALERAAGALHELGRASEAERCEKAARALSGELVAAVQDVDRGMAVL